MTPKKQFEYKKGIAVRMINNPDGYNKHKVNSEVVKQEDIDLKEEAKSLYIQLWKKRNELKSLAQRYGFVTRKLIGVTDKDLEE